MSDVKTAILVVPLKANYGVWFLENKLTLTSLCNCGAWIPLGVMPFCPLCGRSKFWDGAAQTYLTLKELGLEI